LVNEQVAEVKRIESVIAGFREEIAQARQAIQNDLDASKATISTLEAETLQRLGDTRQTVEKTMQNCKDVVSGLKTTLQEEEDAATPPYTKKRKSFVSWGRRPIRWSNPPKSSSTSCRLIPSPR
jgi:chromosome segregation ATPase